jgi:PAS domain S-box-containing protein
VQSLLIIGLVMQVRRRRRAEESLRASEERYRNVVESQTDLICRYLPDTTLTFVNDAYCRYFNRSRNELLGTKFIEFVPEPARPTSLKRVASLVQEPRTETFEHEVLTSDGTRWQQWVDRVLDPTGRFVEIQGVGRDITDLRRAQIEAEERRKEVTHLTRVAIVGELSGALAHELNQPLAAILSNAQAAKRLLARDPADLEEVGSILGDIASDDKRAAEVINRMRALMKNAEARRQPLDVNELATEVLQLAHSELIQRKIAVTTRLTPSLPDIQGDRVQLQQVLLNLIMNACEAMAANDGIERILEVSTGRDATGSLQITVADRGPGIPGDMMEKIFEPFVTTKEQGLGLGLPICRSIVAAHGGRVWAVNNLDRGASFFVSLPIHAGRET